MRHGKTYEPVPEAPVATPEDDPDLPLTEQGESQVRDAARAMASLGLERAVSSTFLRSRHTAQLIAAPHDLEVSTHAGLRELRLVQPGPGTLRETARRYIALARELEEHPPGEVALDAESSVEQALESAWQALAEALSGPFCRVLAVAHGGLNRLLLARFLGLPLHRFLAIDQNFACVNVIDFVRGGRPLVRSVNLTLHDPFKEREGLI